MKIIFHPPEDPNYAQKVLALLLQAALPSALARLEALASGNEGRL